jgi:hypothetical protein
MQSAYAETFTREMGCTEAEWLMWLPAAIGENPWCRDGPAVRIGIEDGELVLRWREGAPRQIASIRIPRLHVDFAFAGVDEKKRLTFMRRFDLYMQRGGG